MKLECDVIRDLLPLYAEKLASPASSALVEQHLAECEACRAELEQMEKPVPVQPVGRGDDHIFDPLRIEGEHRSRGGAGRTVGFDLESLVVHLRHIHIHGFRDRCSRRG